MSPADAAFLHIEDDVSHMHIGSVGIFEGPTPSLDELKRMIEAKLPLVPRYRERVRFVPFDLGRPVWADDAGFNLDYHVRATALPPPGGDEQLRALVGRVMSQPLDRGRPLWEMWMAHGLEQGHWALLSKLHHCMVDGVSGTDLLTVVLDHHPDPERPAPEPWTPAREPSAVRLLADAVVERATSPYEQYRAARAATRQLRDVTRGLLSLGRLMRPPPGTSLNGPIGPHRRWAWARTSLADVKRVRGALGGTVNDVVLAVIARGFRDLLLGRGEPVRGRVVRSLVPVSVRSPAERGTYNNRVSAMYASLPVGVDDPVERLAVVRAQMDGLKRSKQAVAGEVLTSLSGFAPPMLLALGTRVATRMPQRAIQTVTTNVPGPQVELYAVGRKMLEAFPYVPLGGSIRVGVAIFSYNGLLNYGITGDYDTAPDVGVLARGIEDGMGELLKAAERQ